MLVTSASQAAEAGDEPALIVQSTGVPMAVGPNRQVAIELLLASTKLDLIISDDGFATLGIRSPNRMDRT